MKLALVCCSLLILRGVGGIAVRAINAALDGVIWLLDGDSR